MKRAAPAGRQGYTAIELAITIVIVGILALMFIITVNGAIRSSQLNAATDRLASDLRYARSLASGTAKWYGVSFEVSPTNTYTVYTTTGTVDTVLADPSRLGNNFIINVNSAYKVSISAVNFDGSKEVEFDPLGTPYTNLTAAALSAEGYVTLSNGSATKSVRVTPGTGRIFIQ